MASDQSADDAKRIARFRERLRNDKSDRYLEWDSPEELTRDHMFAAARRFGGGFVTAQSLGALRLFGGEVNAHRVAMADAGAFLEVLQSLVTAAGAVTEGVKTVSGKLPTHIVSRTQLDLAAAPAPGSVVFQFTPHVDESLERYPKDQVRLDETDSLVQRSLTSALSALSLASDGDPSKWAAGYFEDAGPRLVSALLRFIDTASAADVNVDLWWSNADGRRRRSVVTAQEAREFSAFLKGQNLDAEPVTLEGTLQTVSKKRALDIVLDQPLDDGETEIQVNAGEVDVTKFRVDDRVRINALLRVTERPGRSAKRSYTATRVVTD